MENNLLDANDINTAEDVADNIATEITKILIEAFKAKENREPTNVEIQLLIEELTEERINALLSGKVEEEEEVKEIDEEEVADADDDEKHENDITNNDDKVIDQTIIDKINTDDLKENLQETKTSVESNKKRSSLDNGKDVATLATTNDDHLTILKDNINYNIDELDTKRCKVEDI